MTRHFWAPALALGAALATNGVASADDSPRPSTTMTLGGKGTAAQAAVEDSELTHGRGYRGYYGWGGGYGGYRGYYGGYGGYYGGYRGYYGGGYGGYRSYYGGGWGGYYGYRPAYYSSYYSFGYRPYYSSFYYPVYSSYYSAGPSFYLGIGGGLTSGAPTVTLGESFARPPVVTQSTPPMTAPNAPGDGTFPYDGGPINPVPLPKSDPQAIPPANPSSATDLPISLKPKAATTPYKYKAYGEK